MLKCVIKCTSEHHQLKNENISKNIEDVWDSSAIHRVSYATTLSGYIYFYPKHNYFLLYLGGRRSPKGGAPPFSPIFCYIFIFILYVYVANILPSFCRELIEITVQGRAVHTAMATFLSYCTALKQFSMHGQGTTNRKHFRIRN